MRILFVVFALLCFWGAQEISSSHRSPQLDRSSYFRPPPRHLKSLSFGFHDLMADFLWLRFIQDVDQCRTFNQSQKESCSKGWGYQMLLAIHELAPRFRIPMAVGPMSLSVLQDDIEGAHELFVLAASAFPHDWPILYRAAYHFIYEKEDPKRAAEYLNAASRYGGPPWLNSLASRLYEKTGRFELALKTLQDYRRSLNDPQARKKVDERIQRIKAELTP